MELIEDWKSGQRCPIKRRRRWRRRVETVDAIGVHATAVAGGFGVARYQLRAAMWKLQKRGEDKDGLDVEGGRESLRHVVEVGRAQGCPISKVTAHANHSNKPFDPGAEVWRAIVEPVADELGLEVLADWTTRGHRPVIADWRCAV